MRLMHLTPRATAHDGLVVLRTVGFAPVGITLLGAAALLVAACGGRDAGATRAKDSAGIRILESKGGEPDSLRGWQISRAPSLSIGVESGPEHFQFSRVGGVARLDDGRIAVGDGGSSQLRLFDSTGGFIDARGGKGQGPGEFGEFSSLRIWRDPGGELLVNDSGNERINVYAPDGTYLRSVQLAPAPDGPRVFLVDLFGDGTWLASAPAGGGRLSGDVVGPLAPTEFGYHRYSPTGAHMRRLLSVTDRPRYVNAFGTSRHFPYIPLTPEPRLAARDSSVLVYRGPGAEIELWDASGQQRGVVRWRSVEPRRVADIWERYVTASLDGMQGDQRARYQHFYRQNLALPTIVPAADALLVDAVGDVWVRRYRLPWEQVQRWDVISRQGEWVTAVDAPEGLNIAQVGRDFLIGTHRDSLGVERIRLHRLARPAGGEARAARRP